METARDLPVLLAVQDALLAYVARWHVAIEINPSSNLLVGGLRSPFDQPAFHKHDIPITISADDPLTFATTLADEYAYAWAGMVAGSDPPVKPAEATRRLDEAAANSVRFSFIDFDRAEKKKR